MNKFGNLWLDSSAFCIPILILLWLFTQSIVFVITEAFLIIAMGWLLFKFATKEVRFFDDKIDTLKSVDGNACLPLIGLTIPAAEYYCNLPVPIIIAFVALFVFLYWKANLRIYNPLLLLFGWHYYEVSIGGVEFLLISKETSFDKNKTKTFGRLKNYVLISLNGA